MKRQKTTALVVALMALAMAVLACNKADSTPTATTGSTPTATVGSTPTATVGSTPTATAGSTPTATAKAFFEAAKTKDTAGLRNAMSKGSLQMMEQFAKMDNKSLDDFLKTADLSPTSTFESRNEKITGDSATVEVKDEKGTWDTIPLVKEDGQWKIALDKGPQGGGGDTPSGAENPEAPK